MPGSVTLGYAGQFQFAKGKTRIAAHEQHVSFDQKTDVVIRRSDFPTIKYFPTAWPTVAEFIIVVAPRDHSDLSLYGTNNA